MLLTHSAETTDIPARRPRRLEAVTLRSYISLVAAALLVITPALVGATGPLPQREVYVAPGNLSISFVRDELSEKQPIIQEECTPRPLVLCVGPYDPDYNIEFGATGVRVLTNDTNATVGHDPARHFAYGPYSMYGGLDDVRICDSGCKVPNSVYGSAQGNVTIVVYYFGKEETVSVALERRDVELDRPPLLQPTCRLSAWYTCISLA